MTVACAHMTLKLYKGIRSREVCNKLSFSLVYSQLKEKLLPASVIPRSVVPLEFTA